MSYQYQRAKPRGVRPELPNAAPGSNIYPGYNQWGPIDLPNPSAATVSGLPAASRARNLIANAVAQMAPLQMWTSDGFISDTTPTVLTRPLSTLTTFDFWNMAVSETIMHGNFLGILSDFDSDGYPQQVVPVPWGFWVAYYDQAGYLVFKLGKDLYSRDQVVHVRANGAPNQPMGVGVVTQFRRALGMALDQQNYAADTYRSGSVPAGVIELDLPEVDPVQAENVVTQWISNHSGGRAPAVLPNTMKFLPLAWSPEDAQFLQSREFNITEVALMFNLDPTDLGAALPGASMTYANIEQRAQARITDSYAPWMCRFEQEWSDLIPGSNTARFNPDRLLRTDSETRAKVDQLEIANETATVDEARKRLGKKPLPKPKVAPLAPGTPPTGANGAQTGAVLADAPQPVPDDPNLTATPVKVKI